MRPPMNRYWHKPHSTYALDTGPSSCFGRRRRAEAALFGPGGRQCPPRWMLAEDAQCVHDWLSNFFPVSYSSPAGLLAPASHEQSQSRYPHLVRVDIAVVALRP